ncbi:MAG: glutamyl-tRNA reductase [Candidatus Poribacteria bacterium]|nr:glutamyl-tRNA reductase [Candidatus Poribacteria bacterium]
MNQIVSIGTSHHIAPVEFREKLAFSEEQLIESLHHLRESHKVDEAVILSTCNRVEVYGVANSQRTAKSPVSVLFDFLSDYHRISVDTLKKWSYRHHNLDTILHLFRVTSSLDSMVVGESQILGQVKEAYDFSRSAGGAGAILNRLFAKAFSVGKRIRSETTIAAGAVSISYAAVELAKKIFNTLENKTVAIIGAGEMSELTAKHLVANGVSKVIVANRTYERAVKIAEKFKGVPVAYEENLNFLIDADIVISSTDAPYYLIERKPLAEIMRKRKHRYMFLIDIAVPRDIEPDVSKINHAFLYNIDDLEAVVASNLQERKQEAVRAEQIVSEEAKQFHDQLQILEVNPTIKALHQQFQQIAECELKVCLGKTTLSDTQEDAVASMTQAIVKKLLHHPVENLRHAVNDGNADHGQYVHALQELFALDNNDDKEQE